jgi:ATP-dependent DNA helicase RecG
MMACGRENSETVLSMKRYQPKRDVNQSVLCMLSEKKLTALVADLETDRVERKERATDLDRIRQAICAYANDLPNYGTAGVVVVGMRDDGTCAHTKIDDQMLTTLAGLRSDGKVLPFPTMHVSAGTIDDCRVAFIVVEPSDNPPVRVDGRVWIRVGPRRAQATPEEERRLTEKRRWGNLPFDHQAVPHCTLQDLDLVRFRLEYLPAALPPEVIDENTRTPDDQMRALRLLRGDIPTVTAVLVLGKEPRGWLPGAYIQFARFDGIDVTAPIKDQLEISGTVVDQLRRLDDKLEAHVEVQADLSGPTEVRRPSYPIEALREFTRNAVTHRNYESTSTPVRVHWYEDRVEITSPGGLYGSVTADNFGQPNATDYRNPALAGSTKEPRLRSALWDGNSKSSIGA